MNRETTARFSPMRIAGILVVAAALSASTFAFTATNTVEPSNVGAGSGAISGYAITDVSYGLDDIDPQLIIQVTFTLGAKDGDPPPADGATVMISLDGATTWHECDVTDTSATCDTSVDSPAVVDAVELTVVATS